ncbi:hypothetical protein L6279_03555 [Candidatus Parcubacteria bacterium]|nr:hypothetical protein [Patescibacteria group bacterium]MCG2693157.1 hypothetical protein [Candidatus Parcubacteria bacterium]
MTITWAACGDSVSVKFPFGLEPYRGVGVEEDRSHLSGAQPDGGENPHYSVYVSLEKKGKHLHMIFSPEEAASLRKALDSGITMVSNAQHQE